MNSYNNKVYISKVYLFLPVARILRLARSVFFQFFRNSKNEKYPKLSTVSSSLTGRGVRGAYARDNSKFKFLTSSVVVQNHLFIFFTFFYKHFTLFRTEIR